MIKIKKLELLGGIVYIDGVEAFYIKPGGGKEPITLSAWEAYRAQQVLVDDWLERQTRN